MDRAVDLFFERRGASVPELLEIQTAVEDGRGVGFPDRGVHADRAGLMIGPPLPRSWQEAQEIVSFPESRRSWKSRSPRFTLSEFKSAAAEIGRIGSWAASEISGRTGSAPMTAGENACEPSSFQTR